MASGLRTVRIAELLQDPGRRELAASPEADALTEPDALQEAYLVGVHVHAVLGQAWLLFDCRGALQIEMGNTAIVAVHGLRSFTWTAEPRGLNRTQWTVVSWVPNAVGSVWQVTAGMTPSAQLTVSGDAAEFYVGNIPGGDEPPPDFGEASDGEIRSRLVEISSEFSPVHASFLSKA
jgi:hypothetical protein